MRKGKVAQLIPTEHEEQSQFLQMAQMLLSEEQFALLFAVPNGDKRSISVAIRLKQEGVKAGIPDMIFAYPHKRWSGLFIEMKRRKGGRVSDEQKQYIKLLRQVGYRAEVCKGCDEALATLKDYLS